MSQATSHNANTVLVTGASGHLGHRAVELLLLRGDVKVIAASRTPDKLADLAAQGAELRRLDFDDDASLSTSPSAASASVSKSARSTPWSRRA
jgi:NAD(P)H dehydrogenase (quinone)